MKTIFQYNGKLLPAIQIKKSMEAIEYLFVLLQADDGKLYWVIRDRAPGQEVKISLTGDETQELTGDNTHEMMSDLAEMLAYTEATNAGKMKVAKQLITKMKKVIAQALNTDNQNQS